MWRSATNSIARVHRGAARRQSACLARALSTDKSRVDAPLMQYVSLSRLAHQSRFNLLISDATRATIRVEPTLEQSDFALRVYDMNPANSANDGASREEVFAVHEELDEQKEALKAVRVTHSGGAFRRPIEVVLHLPHMVDLDIAVVHGLVQLADKIEGNVRVALGDGEITVNKVRGALINLKTNRGSILVNSLIEGEQVKLAATAVQVKRLMSGSTEIKLAKGTEDSEVGAIYSSVCLINSMSSGSLKVGNIHGFLRVAGDDMRAVQVNSINGTIDIVDSGAQCQVDAHFDSWGADSANKIFVGGNVRVSLDPTAPIDVELHGNKILTDGCKFGASELDQLDDDYAIFTGEVHATVVAGDGSGTSGKINVGSAKSSALRTSFFATEHDASSVPHEGGDQPARLPRLLVHASNGSVALEQLDWMGRVKRKHLKQ